MYAVDIVTLPQ